MDTLNFLKYVLKLTKDHNCTIFMLYMIDKRSRVTSIEDLQDYKGDIISCLEIIEELDNKTIPEIEIVKILISIYRIDTEYAHQCMAIYMGGLGKINHEYIKKYPESIEMISNTGTLLEYYFNKTQECKVLYNIISQVDHLPVILLSGDNDNPNFYLSSEVKKSENDEHIGKFQLLSSQIFCFFQNNLLNLKKTFEENDAPLDIFMECLPSIDNFGKQKYEIRRKISINYSIANIPRRYIKISMKDSDQNGFLMGRYMNKDFKVYRDHFMFEEKNEENIADVMIDQICKVIKVKHSQMLRTNMKMSLEFETKENWDQSVIVSMINEHQLIKKIISISELKRTLHKNNVIVVYCLTAKCFFYYDTTNKFKIKISGVKDSNHMNMLIAIMTYFLNIYDKQYQKYYYDSTKLKRKSKVSKNINKNKSIRKEKKIDTLRNKLPELFVYNYSRECHILPIMIESKQDVQKYIEMGRAVIKYPLKGKYKRWYTSPSNDYYVGLKPNRLPNKDLFEYIVVCYTSNHMNRISKETYNYYIGRNYIKLKNSRDINTLKILEDGRKGPISSLLETELNIKGYKRLGTGGSFINCVEYALGIKRSNFMKILNIKKEKGILNVVKQELWNMSDEDIYNNVKDYLYSIDGTIYYRLFEEIYKCNIIIIEIENNGKYKMSIPPYKRYYIWGPCKWDKYIVIVKNTRKLYHNAEIFYELIIYDDDNTASFTKDNPFISKLIEMKASCENVYDNELISRKNVLSQFINDDGKCCLVHTKYGELKRCDIRPLYCPIVNTCKYLSPNSLIKNHIKGKWMSSNNKYKYFPNDSSFISWLKI